MRGGPVGEDVRCCCRGCAGRAGIARQHVKKGRPEEPTRPGRGQDRLRRTRDPAWRGRYRPGRSRDRAWRGHLGDGGGPDAGKHPVQPVAGGGLVGRRRTEGRQHAATLGGHRRTAYPPKPLPVDGGPLGDNRLIKPSPCYTRAVNQPRPQRTFAPAPVP
ncbi:hypothetical protein CS0771_00590 [Catellatospora sp. IY07-71]|nr:hypothetical protein CS0771_00590 [Catellatospora sp. IY07-71]